MFSTFFSLSLRLKINRVTEYRLFSYSLAVLMSLDRCFIAFILSLFTFVMGLCVCHKIELKTSYDLTIMIFI